MQHWQSRILAVLGSALLSAVLLSTSVAAAPATTLDPKLPVHPYLQYGARVEPDRRVRVVVQLKNHLISRANIARVAGASKYNEYAFVNGMAMEVPQRAVLGLAKIPGVRYISYDGPVRHRAIDASQLKETYEGTLGTSAVWNDPTVPATGKGVTVAVLDTGVNSQLPDFGARVTCLQVSSFSSCNDENGHGTHVIGIINGRDAAGRYIGVAPDANVLSVRIGDANGLARTSDVIAGLQWIYDNRATYNIRVVNLSIGASIAESYVTSAVDAAVEQLWLNGVTVVAAAGNRGTAIDATWYAPGNDPFAISVGALDDNDTTIRADDSLATFSSRGPTQDGFAKPEVVAPGRRIVSTLAGSNVTLAQQFPDRIVDVTYLRLSGTSMASPMVTGLIALLLERYPSLTPNQIKWLAMTGTVAYPGQLDRAGMVTPSSVLALAATGSIGQANLSLVPSSAINPVSGTVQWAQSYWNDSYWNDSYWNDSMNILSPDQAYWD